MKNEIYNFEDLTLRIKSGLKIKKINRRKQKIFSFEAEAKHKKSQKHLYEKIYNY